MNHYNAKPTSFIDWFSQIRVATFLFIGLESHIMLSEVCLVMIWTGTQYFTTSVIFLFYTRFALLRADVISFKTLIYKTINEVTSN